MEKLASSFLEKLAWRILVPAALLLLCFPPVIDGPIVYLDQNIWLSVQQALLHGRALYRDVWFQYGPLTVLPLRLAEAWVDPTLASVRWVIWLMNAGGLLVAYGCVCRYVQERSLRLVTAFSLFLVPTAMAMFIPTSARYGAGFLPLLFWPTSSADDRRVVRLSMLTGVAAVVAMFISQEVGVAAAAASAVYLFLFSTRRRPLLFCAAAVLLTLGMAIGVIAAYCGVESFLRCTVFDIGRLTLSMRLPFPRIETTFWSDAWHWRIPWAIPFWNLGILAAFVFPVAMILSGGFSAFRQTRQRALIGGLTTLVLFTAPTAWTRSDGHHIYFALSPSFLLAAVLVGRESGLPSAFRSTLTFAFVALCAVMVLPSFFRQRLLDRIYEPTFRTLRLARGGGCRLPEFQVGLIEAVAKRIQRRVPPDEPVFLYPMDGSLYFLADRLPASRQLVPLQGWLPLQQQEVVESLDRSRTHWLVFNEALQLLDGKSVDQWLETEATYIKSHFQRRDSISSFGFYERVP